MEKRKNKRIIALLLIGFSASLAVGSSLAWFRHGETISFGEGNRVPIKAGAEAAYFAGGDGSEGNPWQIANRTHLYNLAWLQYIGYFDGSDDSRPLQPYFVLTNNIDMTNITLPPIGTEEHPFIGNFDGAGKTISNLKVSNDDPKQAVSDFGVAKPSMTDLNKTNNPPEIVGFFGVVGKYTSSFGNDYDSSIVSMTNFTLEDITVTSKTTKTLIGLAAGYVDGYMDGVKVGGSSTIDLGGSPKSIKNSSISTKLSDYSLVGYSTQTNTSGLYTQTFSEYYDSATDGTGPGQNWGGSLDLVELYYDLVDIVEDSTTIDSHHQVLTIDENGNPEGPAVEEVKAIGKFKNYRDGTNDNDWSASYGFTSSDLTGTSSASIKLTGSQYQDLVTIDKRVTTKTFFFGSSGNFYYGAPNQETIIRAQNSSGIIVDGKYSTEYGWKYTGSATSVTNGAELGYLYTEYEGVNYYLNVSDNLQTSGKYFLELTTTPINSWTIFVGKYKYIKTQKDGVTYYFRKSYNTATDSTGSATGLTMVFQDDYSSSTSASNVKEHVYDTCFPHSTGYIVSGSTIEGGDISISVHNSYSSFYPVDNQTPLTINGSGKINASEAQLDGYSEAKTAFDEMLTNCPTKQFKVSDNNYRTDSYWCGLKFMDAAIDINDTVTVPSLNWELPKNCLTFNVANKGLAKFFAGTYANTEGLNNAFFSLYKINRSGNALSSLTEIKYIWKKTGSDYVYTDSNTSPGTDYSLVFDSNWITNPGSNFEANRFYYFEIPLNAGEYCLGSVSGSLGASLMYLDIGANGSDIDTLSAYYVDTNNSSLPFPVGVDFAVTYVNSGQTGSTEGGITCAISIAASSDGAIAFSVSSATISVNITNNSTFSSNIEYKGQDTSKYFISIDSGASYITDVTTGFTGSSTRTIYARISNTLGVTTATIKIVGSVSNGSFTPSTYYLNNTQVSGMSDLPSSLSINVLNAINAKNEALVLTRESGNTFDAMATLPWTSKTNYALNISESNVSLTIVRLSNTYTVSVNGTNLSFTNNQASYSRP